MKSEAWRIGKLGDKPRYTWQEAVIRWSNEQTHRKCASDDKKYLRFLHPYLHDKTLCEINKSTLERIKHEKLNTGASPATANRVLAFIRALLNRAKNDWEWLDVVPNIKLMKEIRQRIRWITQEQANRLFQELPEHIEAMARFSLATGLRESNVTSLQWSQVDLKRSCAWIHADQAKAGKSISVPLNNDALNVLRSQIGKHETNVFTYKNKPVGVANTKAWRAALVRAGISDFRWHDLRHTWASWHVQNGTPLHVLKELGGWADLTMVLRYAHLSSEHLSEFAGNAKVGTNQLHAQKSPESRKAVRA
jgi:integrase